VLLGSLIHFLQKEQHWKIFQENLSAKCYLWLSALHDFLEIDPIPVQRFNLLNQVSRDSYI
jgi:hypothetical protein